MASNVHNHYVNLSKQYDKKLNLYCQNRFLRIVKKYAKGKILDVGCGTGYAQKRVGHNIIGLDVTYALLELNKNIRVCGDALTIPFKDNSFDVVYSIDVIEHIKKPQKLVNECKRILKKKGILILITPNGGMEIPLDAAEKLRLKLPEGDHKFLLFKELQNVVKNSNMDIIFAKKFILFPLQMNFITTFFEKLETFFPFFCLFQYVVSVKK